jgi:predicted Zn-dependent peptidase
MINDVGGTVNGSTSQDRTNYWQIVPANQLELVLWLEADRMRSLKVTKENFENQRATVKEERRLRIDNQPYMRAVYELKDDLAYANYAYKHSVIGSMEELDRASLEDVQSFHRIYYRPNNAVLSLVGDFEVEEALKKVEHYFADIPAGPMVPAVNLSEPVQSHQKSASQEDSFAPYPAVLISYHAPERTHRDYFAFQLLEKILFDGESSRFHHELVEQEQSALHVFGGLDGKIGPSLFFIFAQVHPQATLTQLKESIEKVFHTIREKPIGPEEIEKAKNKLKSDFITQQETVRSMADIFCLYAMVYNDPTRFYGDLEEFERVTADQLYRIAQKYFVAQNQSILEVLPRNGEVKFEKPENNSIRD